MAGVDVGRGWQRFRGVVAVSAVVEAWWGDRDIGVMSTARAPHRVADPAGDAPHRAGSPAAGRHRRAMVAAVVEAVVAIQPWEINHRRTAVAQIPISTGVPPRTRSHCPLCMQPMAMRPRDQGRPFLPSAEVPEAAADHSILIYMHLPSGA